MKTIRISAFEERWLREALRDDIVALEEWEESPTNPLNKGETKQLNLLRKFAEELPFRLTNAPLRPDQTTTTKTKTK